MAFCASQALRTSWHPKCGEINDTLGHDGGDFLLKTVAERLRATTRLDDVVARLGGDEFVVIQSDVAGKEQAEEFARRLVSALIVPMQFEGHAIMLR